jgi:ADP-ribosylglycohydrolase
LWTFSTAGHRDAARAAFGGQGSMGNGAAMHSAEVTHAHGEAILGAVAVAVAAAEAGWARLIGDVDTTAAIVGGIVGAYKGKGVNGIPATWLASREPLPDLS